MWTVKMIYVERQSVMWTGKMLFVQILMCEKVSWYLYSKVLYEQLRIGIYTGALLCDRVRMVFVEVKVLWTGKRVFVQVNCYLNR